MSIIFVDMEIVKKTAEMVAEEAKRSAMRIKEQNEEVIKDESSVHSK